MITKRLEISKINSLIDVKVFKQGYTKKRKGGSYNESRIKTFIYAFCTSWRKKWITITEEGISYSKYPCDGVDSITDMLYFDKTINIKFGYIIQVLT